MAARRQRNVHGPWVTHKQPAVTTIVESTDYSDFGFSWKDGDMTNGSEQKTPFAKRTWDAYRSAISVLVVTSGFVAFMAVCWRVIRWGFGI